MKIVISGSYGGFHIDRRLADTMVSLGCQAPQLLANLERSATEYAYDFWYGCPRNNKYLVEAVEKLSVPSRGGNYYGDLTVVEVDMGKPWYLDEYDGWESIKYFDSSERGCELE